jgi:hypothetical protein
MAITHRPTLAVLAYILALLVPHSNNDFISTDKNMFQNQEVTGIRIPDIMLMVVVASLCSRVLLFVISQNS